MTCEARQWRLSCLAGLGTAMKVAPAPHHRSGLIAVRQLPGVGRKLRGASMTAAVLAWVMTVLDGKVPLEVS